MAEWRALGFVPDSDDEDDTQDSSRFEEPSSEDGHHLNIGNDREAYHTAGKPVDLPQGFGGKRQDRGFGFVREIGERGIDTSTRTASNTSNQSGRFVAVEIRNDKISDSYRQVSRIEDIDELQQDHYQSLPATRIDTVITPNNESENGIFRRTVTPPRPSTLIESSSSSPLTELPSSPTPPPFLLKDSITEFRHVNDFEYPSSTSTQPPVRLNSANKEETALESRNNGAQHDWNRATRNLRQRNPIQLHPYALESEKYRQILKARGIKPLRIAPARDDLTSAPREDSLEEDFDEAEFYQLQNNEDESQILASTLPICESDEPMLSSPPNAELFRVEEEFPDVGALIRNHPSGAAVGGAKRRKVAHEYHNTTHASTLTTKANVENLNISSLDAGGNIPHGPMSPPRSGESTPLKYSQYAKSGFRIPRGLSPVTLPTPITSSEPPMRSAFTEAEMEAEKASTLVVESSDDDSLALEHSNSSSSENDTNRQLERVQRKIRGVLPASWLKIDLQKQKNQRPAASLRTRLDSSPEIVEKPRGVAKHVSAPKKRNINHLADNSFPIIVSDETESDSSLEQLTNLNSRGSSGISSQFRDDFNDNQDTFTVDRGEALEDNRVDEMVYSTKRRKGFARKKRKLQAKISSEKSRQVQFKDLKFSKPDRKNPSKQPRITDRFSKTCQKRPVFRPPKLSILDISAQGTSKTTPPFLKIASRTVRSRVDKGRHSPSRKFIRLATIDETNDACEALKCWREGKSMPNITLPKFSNKPSRRHPLHPRSGNNQSPSRAAVPLKRAQKVQSPLLPVAKPRVKPHQNTMRKFQSSLDRSRIIDLSFSSGGNRRISATMRQKGGSLGRGQLSTSLTTTSDSRPANLESLKDANNRSKSQKAFQRYFSYSGQDIYQSVTPNILLQRFFDDSGETASKAKAPDLFSTNNQPLDRMNIVGSKVVAKRDKRKRLPQKVDLNTPKFRQKSLSVHIDVSDENQDSTSYQATGTIAGLGPFGSRYTQNFDIKPLMTGTYLHPSTFVGSGVFSKSLNAKNSDNMETSRGFARIRHKGEEFKCGPWNDTVSVQIGTIFNAISERVLSSSSENGRITNEQIVSQTDLIDYFSHHLSFHDAIDRNSCLERCRGLVMRLLENIDVPLETPQKREKGFKLQTLTLCLGFTNQLCQISQHDLVQLNLKAQINSLMLEIARQVLFLAVNDGFESLSRCLDNLKHLEACEYGIKEDIGSIEAIVVAHHILRESDESLAAFWNIVTLSVISKEANTTTDVGALERSWLKLFTILPFLEFDVHGIIKQGQRFRASNDNWSLIKGLVSRVLEAYIQKPGGQGPTFNAYCRALFTRCLHLIKGWGWRKPELIIGNLFDFFARNNLAHLKNEESHGSPQFLEHLDKNPQLEASPEDRSFHLFLKILGTGLSQMSSIYPEKRIRDVVWRLMPNHGRFHPKEETIHQKDLDALRNHHDLLCTLYWASPAAARPPLGVIRNLVNIESSHREACHINIRTWSNLVRFQLSTDEDISNLKPFAVWHDDLLSQLIRQYKYARSEAEEHARSVESTGFHISQNLLESNISRNQRQTAASLGDALSSLELAVDATRNVEQASVLVTPTLVTVFDLYDARRPQAHANIIQALDVILRILKIFLLSQIHHGNGSTSDDSQDYGDWSAFEDIDVAATNNNSHPIPNSAAVQPHIAIYEPLKKLLSNCFGADTIPEDSLLLKVTHAWVAMAQILVHQGMRSWGDYITQFGQDSWSSLRQTEQTRKFTTYFLALLLENEHGVFEEHPTFFLTAWIESLVERESLIKFQHQLTTAMLNLGSSHAVLRNLPFWSESTKGHFDVTRIEFSERRLSLIHCILSNMRESIESASIKSSLHLLNLKQDYSAILRALMTSIKRNYQELGHDSNFKSAYVGFVHRVIEFLQQHTSDIYPIDRFFTDSAAFPLPTTDPTYVVGRLKNYGLRLQDTRTPKQLSVFLQSVSERAVVDGQQDYLAGQLYAAISNAFEHGDASRPTLRSFLIKAILPAYIQAAFSTSCGWLLALPFLMALVPVFQGLLTCLDGSNSISVDGVLTVIVAFLDSSRTSLGLLVDHSGVLEQHNILEALSAIYSAITALLPVLDYIARLSAPVQPAIQGIEYFEKFAVFASALLQEHYDPDIRFSEMLDDVMTLPGDNLYAEVHAFTLRELRDSLSKNWAYRNGRYYLIRGGNAPREVAVSDVWSSSYDEAKQGLLSAIADFFTRLEALPFFGGGNVSNVPSMTRSGMEDCVF